VLADLPAAGESVLPEEFDRSAEQETARRLTADGHLGDGLDEAAAGMGDLFECALQGRRPRDGSGRSTSGSSRDHHGQRARGLGGGL